MHADHATYAAFWQCRLEQLEVGFISRVTSGTVGALRRLRQLHRSKKSALTNQIRY